MRNPRKHSATRWWRNTKPDGAVQQAIDLAADWYRLVPIGLGSELVRPLHPELRDGVPFASTPSLDLRLVPPYSLMDVRHPTRLLVSRGFAKGLADLGATVEWAVEPVCHITPNKVAGLPCAWLRLGGTAGRLTKGALKKLPRGRAKDDLTNAVPFSPATIDVGSASGHSVAPGVQWFGSGVGAWQAVFARSEALGVLFRALDEAGDERWFGLEAVSTLGVAPTPRARRAKPSTFPKFALPPRRSVPQVLSHLKRTAREYEHQLPPGPTTALPEGLHDRSLVAFLTAHDGADLFAGALSFFSTKGSPRLDKATAASARMGCDVSAGEQVFATSPGLGVFWALDGEGLVRGLQRTGLRYGPRTDFRRWLHDLVADLEYATTCVEDPWAVRLLGR